MTKKTTRREQYSDLRGTLYLAFELGLKEWKLGFSIGLGQKARRRTIPGGDLEKLVREIAAAKKRFELSETAPVVSCYEAGRDGFWLDRYLTQSGVRNLVVDSASIEVNRRRRRAKSDRLDVQKLLTMLIRYEYGEHKVWSVVRAPSPEEEDRRQCIESCTVRRRKRRGQRIGSGGCWRRRGSGWSLVWTFQTHDSRRSGCGTASRCLRP